MLILLPLLVLLLGVLIYNTVEKRMPLEFGRACIWIGLFWSVAVYAERFVHLLPK